MTDPERRLLITTAKALLELLWWKNVDGRRLGAPIEGALKELEQEMEKKRT